MSRAPQFTTQTERPTRRRLSDSECPEGSFAWKEVYGEYNCEEACGQDACYDPANGYGEYIPCLDQGTGECFGTWSANAANFNGAILGWDTSSVTNMENTFQNAKAFNVPLDWDTSSVVNMKNTFYNADAFNSELVWDTSSVTNMEGTFSNDDASVYAPVRSNEPRSCEPAVCATPSTKRRARAEEAAEDRNGTFAAMPTFARALRDASNASGADGTRAEDARAETPFRGGRPLASPPPMKASTSPPAPPRKQALSYGMSYGLSLIHI